MPDAKASKANQKRSDAALESFHHYYGSLWGEERWGSLFSALSQQTRYCALINRFATPSQVQEILADSHDTGTEEYNLSSSAGASYGSVVKYPLALQSVDKDSFPPPSQVSSTEAGKLTLSHWNMDFASILAACMLQARPGDRVLDLCAAPGGKSIVLAQMLWPEYHAGGVGTSENTSETSNTCLHSNEADHARYKRLITNMHSYLPSLLFTDNAVKVVQIDGSTKSAVHEMPLGAEGYDKVLLDAPCSSERHIVHAHLKAASAGQRSDELANWKPSRTKTLAKTQAALLMTALKAVKLGGKVLYATCSISDEENDNVIAKTLEAVKRERKKNADSVQVCWSINFDTSFEKDRDMASLLGNTTEPTKYGRIALPDHGSGGRWGPLYVCLMQKLPYKSKTKVSLDDPH